MSQESVSRPKVWFVTGASRGFGRIWTEAALKRGDKVAATARDPKALDELATAYGEAVLALPLDVTDRDAVFATVARAHRHFGRLDVILCNAGYGYMSAVEEIDPDQARANLETNVFGTLSVIQAALPFLRKQGSGHILTLSSIGGILSPPTGGIYLASKFAIEALSESLSGEVADFGIKVTIIEPASFATTFRSSTRLAPSMPEYEQLRRTIHGAFTADMQGDPRATVAALFQVVDADQPPLRLILGSWLLPMIRKAYQERLDTWNAWEPVSIAAQGKGAPRDP